MGREPNPQTAQGTVKPELEPSRFVVEPLALNTEELACDRQRLARHRFPIFLPDEVNPSGQLDRMRLDHNRCGSSACLVRMGVDLVAELAQRPMKLCENGLRRLVRVLIQP